MAEVDTLQIELPKKGQIQKIAKKLTTQMLEAKLAGRVFEARFEVTAVFRTLGLGQYYVCANLSDADFQSILENINSKLAGSGLEAVGLVYTGGLFSIHRGKATQSWDLVITVVEG